MSSRPAVSEKVVSFTDHGSVTPNANWNSDNLGSDEFESIVAMNNGLTHCNDTLELIGWLRMGTCL